MATVILLLLASVVLAEQYVFSPETKAGLVRRFEVDASETAELVIGAAQDHNLDVWHITDSFVDLYFPFRSSLLPPELASVAHTTNSVAASMTYTSSTPLSWNLSSLQNSTYHSEYHPLYEIEQFIHELADLHPNLTRLVPLGHSGEGREMLGIEISRGYPPEDSCARPGLDPCRRLGFVVMGAQHAREWVATSTALYLAHALVADATSPHSLLSLLDTFDFYIIPSPNPDGYSYTWSTDRFWYKNRQTLGPNSTCTGLDMNRNWGYKWKPNAPVLISSTKKKQKPADECSHWFPGHRAFESPEVNNIANYLTTLPNLVGFVSLRNYGQMLSTPYSYSSSRIPKDSEDQIEAATGAVHTLRKVHGTAFTTGRLSNTLYPAPGNILDYVYSKVRIKYAYTAHLRDTGTYGFSLPPSWIRPVGEETAEMIRYLAKFIKDKVKR